MTDRTSDRLTIGAVLARLRPEFDDISISKIRFLEAEGLVTPARTPSGYRTYGDADVERLRYVLVAQRDRFWPLKVIREALDALDRGLQPAEHAPSARPTVPAPVPDPALPGPEDLAPREGLRLTAAELCTATALDPSAVEALVTYGLVRPDAHGHFGEAELAVARAAGALAAYGLEPRHLRPFRTAADREIGLVEQVVRPLRARGLQAERGAHRAAERGGEQPADPDLTTRAVLASCIALHIALVRAGLGRPAG